MTRDFVSRATVVVAVSQLVPALAWGELARLAGLPWPRWIGLLMAAGVVALAPSRMRMFRWDYPRSPLVLHLVDEPFFANVCASLMSAPVVVAAIPVMALGDLLFGGLWEHFFRVVLALYGSCVVLSGWGVFVRRWWPRVRRVDVSIRGLPESFEGFTIAHLSDLHLGGLNPRSMIRRWVEITNDLSPDLVALTGDYITSGTAFHLAIADELGALRARDGVVFSMGNHDYFGEGQPMLSLFAERGLRALRNSSITLTRAGKRLRLAGIDDTYTGRADLDTTMEATLRERVDEAQPSLLVERAVNGSDCPTIVLAHNPELFDGLAARGADLVLSGHTHAGQVAVPWAVRATSFVGIRHRYVVGMYALGDSTLVVHPGLGTTGPPIRLGVAPEITLLRLTRR
ncbi:MAG: metallophosphoesterase [Polyangiaceae bacterium]